MKAAQIRQVLGGGYCYYICRPNLIKSRIFPNGTGDSAKSNISSIIVLCATTVQIRKDSINWSVARSKLHEFFRLGVSISDGAKIQACMYILVINLEEDPPYQITRSIVLEPLS